jgi:hypothetical protein
VFSNLFSITLPNIGKYFPGIHFPKENYFPTNKQENYFPTNIGKYFPGIHFPKENYFSTNKQGLNSNC